MFTKRVRVGTAGVAAAKPLYRDVIDWQAVGGAIVIVLIILAVLSNIG